MRLTLLLALAGLAFAAPAGAQTQRSLFDAPEAATAPAAKPRPAAKPKPRGPVPARALQVVNDSETTVARIDVRADGKTASLTKPLGPKAKATLKLPALKSCTVAIDVSFMGSPIPDTTEQDICADKTLRLTD